MKPFLFSTLLSLSLAACMQSEGETCQTNLDCKDDLVCCLPALSSLEGRCTASRECVSDGGTEDATPSGG